MLEDPIRPGDWVVWSDFYNEQTEQFRKLIGDGPFKVKTVGIGGNLTLHAKNHPFGCFYGLRFRKDPFITAVKEALKDG